MNTSTARQECTTPIIFVNYVQNYRHTQKRLLNSLHRGRGSLGLEWLEGLLYQTPGTFSQHTVLEALIVTGGSPPYFGEQYRDLLLNLYRKLDENNSSSNQQVHNTVQQYIQTVVHDGIKSCGIKFCTFSCSPPRRGAPRRGEWKAESPTKHLCLPRSVNAWARLLTDNYRRGYTRT